MNPSIQTPFSMISEKQSGWLKILTYDYNNSHILFQGQIHGKELASAKQAIVQILKSPVNTMMPSFPAKTAKMVWKKNMPLSEIRYHPWNLEKIIKLCFQFPGNSWFIYDPCWSINYS